MNCFLLDRGGKGWLGFIVWLILVDCFTFEPPLEHCTIWTKTIVLQIVWKWTVGFFRCITILLCRIRLGRYCFFVRHFCFFCFTDGSKEFLMVFLLFERCLFDIVHKLCALYALQRFVNLRFAFLIKCIVIPLPSVYTGQVPCKNGGRWDFW